MDSRLLVSLSCPLCLRMALVLVDRARGSDNHIKVVRGTSADTIAEDMSQSSALVKTVASGSLCFERAS